MVGVVYLISSDESLIMLIIVGMAWFSTCYCVGERESIRKDDTSLVVYEWTSYHFCFGSIVGTKIAKNLCANGS